MRRARDYGLRTHLVERLLERVGGDGWLARLAYDAGLKPPVVVAHDAVCLAALAAGVPPLRLAFASDFHAGPTTDPRAIEQACAALAALEPDLLLLGGDYVSLNARSIEPLATLVGSVPARLGRFAVLGNHDLWADDHLIVRRLQAAGVEVLLAKLARSAINASRRLPAPYDQLWLCGLDDPTSGQPDVITTFDDATGVRLVLMHVPEGLGLLDGVRFELALSGCPTTR